MFDGKQVIVIGERDGVAGPAIAECVKAAGVPVAYIAAETVVLGDPSWAGPLAGVQLGLPVYHILEDEARAAVPSEIWEDQVGLMVDVLEVDEIAEAVREFREQATH